MTGKNDGETKIMLVHETALQSWARDAGSVLAACALILPGWWLSATWLSATGFFLFWIWMISSAIDLRKKQTFSVADARAEIERIAARKEPDQ